MWHVTALLLLLLLLHRLRRRARRLRRARPVGARLCGPVDVDGHELELRGREHREICAGGTRKKGVWSAQSCCVLLCREGE